MRRQPRPKLRRTKMAAKAKAKKAEKKKEYHLKDYLSMCKVNAVILDFKGLRYFLAEA